MFLLKSAGVKYEMNQLHCKANSAYTTWLRRASLSLVWWESDSQPACLDGWGMQNLWNQVNVTILLYLKTIFKLCFFFCFCYILPCLLSTWQDDGLSSPRLSAKCQWRRHFKSEISVALIAWHCCNQAKEWRRAFRWWQWWFEKFGYTHLYIYYIYLKTDTVPRYLTSSCLLCCFHNGK